MPDVPAAAEIPSVLGPFRVTGPATTAPAGSVCPGVDAQGRRATLVVLAPDAATDPAARDRFGTAVAARRPGTVLVDASSARRPWVALPADDAGTSALLDAVLPASSLGAPVRGPGFEPYWKGTRAVEPTGAPDEPSGADGDPRASWWVVGAVVAAAVMVLAGFLGWRILLASDEPADRSAPEVTGAPAPLPTLPGLPPPGDAPVPEGGAPSASPQEPGQPAPDADGSRPLETTGPGVAGPSFTPEDETVEMRLDGLPFAFRVPATWECERDTAVEEPRVRYECVDTAVDADPPGGVVEVEPCPAPCGDEQWEALRRALAPLAAWRPVDARTAVVEDLPRERPGTYRIRMSRVFAATPGSLPDTHVYVEMSAGPQHVDDVQKVVNDIRANTE